VRLFGFAALAAAMTLAACGGGRSATPGPATYDVSVSLVGPTDVAAGTTATFTALVVNIGRNEATNLVITETLSAGYTATVTCTASVNALCPAALGASMTVPSLSPGRSLTFTFQVAVPAASRGSILHQVQVASDKDINPSDNSASITAVVHDARNGAYKAYAANGRVYDLTIDFDALNYTMTIDGTPVQKTFVLVAGEYVVTGTQRLRTATDLVIGNHDFGAGLVPYIAARKFGTTLVDASFNLATRNVAADSSATTHPGTARISGNVLSICQTDVSVQSTQNCPVVLTSYLLSVAGDIYTGVDTTSGAVITFRLARSGASIILLSAVTAPDATQQLRVGLQESAGLTWGTLFGPTNTGDWVTMVLDAANVSWAVLGATTNDQAGLQRISNTGPFGMMVGKRLTDSADIFVLQTPPVAITIGAFDDTANGTFQVAVP